MEQNGTKVHTSARKVPEESRSFVHRSFRVTPACWIDRALQPPAPARRANGHVRAGMSRLALGTRGLKLHLRRLRPRRRSPVRRGLKTPPTNRRTPASVADRFTPSSGPDRMDTGRAMVGSRMGAVTWPCGNAPSVVDGTILATIRLWRMGMYSKGEKLLEHRDRCFDMAETAPTDAIRAKLLRIAYLYEIEAPPDRQSTPMCCR